MVERERQRASVEGGGGGGGRRLAVSQRLESGLLLDELSLEVAVEADPRGGRLEHQRQHALGFGLVGEQGGDQPAQPDRLVLPAAPAVAARFATKASLDRNMSV